MNKRVLVVDDNEDACSLLAELLRIHGHEVVTAADGISALATLESFAADVALLDVGLPGMDGNELAERIRARAGLQPRLVALTGHAAPLIAPAFDLHLLKPISPRRVVEIVGE